MRMPSLVHSTVLIMGVRILLEATALSQKAFDFAPECMIVCAHSWERLFPGSFKKRSGAPHKSGENREAGENPARSRHCEVRRHFEAASKARRPARTLLQLLNARAKVFRPPWELSFRKTSRRQPVAFRVGEGDGILIFKRTVWSAPADARLDGIDASFPSPFGRGLG